jgi:hypothetical protein
MKNKPLIWLINCIGELFLSCIPLYSLLSFTVEPLPEPQKYKEYPILNNNIKAFKLLKEYCIK